MAKLPRWNKGDRITAADLNALADAIRANRVVPDASSGLSSMASPHGLLLSLASSTVIIYATITAECPAFDPSSNAFGLGAGIIQNVSYDGDTCLLGDPVGDPEPIYNPGNAAVLVGRRVMVHRVGAGWHVVSDYCTGA